MYITIVYYKWLEESYKKTDTSSIVFRASQDSFQNVAIIFNYCINKAEQFNTN